MLHLHRSERADALVLPLARVLSEPVADPFAADLVAVPTRGVERWLAQRLSEHLGAADGEAGVCANVRFDPPARVVSDLLAAVLDLSADDDPWRPERLVWPLIALVDECAGEPWCRPLGRHLGMNGGKDDPRRGRRLAAAQHLARLFASYGAQRPAVVIEWLGGRDTDGAGGEVPADLAWQPELWRRLRGRVGVPSPAERLPIAAELCRQAPDRLPLPTRLSVFGATRIPVEQLQLLAAVAEHRDLHLWLPHPSAQLWRRVADTELPSPRRCDVPALARHPMLASMARDATELQLRLHPLQPGDDRHHPAPRPPDNLLGALQRALRADDPDPAPTVLGDDDRSVQVHSCHGRARQVEVLRELLLGLFADDPGLEPRDVIVLCPDIEAFAPLVSATFGAALDSDPAETHPGHTLRVRLADRAVRRTNPSLALLAALLELADGRATASEVLDLAASEPVRRRFGFRDDDLDRVREWAVTGHARWGEDVRRRARFGLQEVPEGTWAAALDRLLLGVAMTDDGSRFVGTAVPLDDVDSTEIDLAGRLAEFVDRLAAVLQELDGVRPLAEWLDLLGRALDLLAAPAPTTGWQQAQAREVLAGVARAGAAAGDLELRLPDVRALLARELEPRPTRAGFRTGALTVCSLEPMRAVPHRVVCLLGVDDGVFPRQASADGDDLLIRDPCIGERDRRGEDRQLFLDAVCAAGDRLLVLYTGADERTGARRPPAVPVAELLDAIDRVAVRPGGASVRDAVELRQPLQPVDERNFRPGELGRDAPFSFDAAAHRAALTARAERRAVPPFLAGPLGAPDDEPDELDLDDLVRALEHPVKWFLRRRLGLVLADDDPDVDDRLPLSLDPLQRWAVGDRMLAACLVGVPRAQAFAAERLRGELPPGRLAAIELSEVESFVLPVARAAKAAQADAGGGGRGSGAASAVDVAVTLADGRRLTGTVHGIFGDTVVRAEYSKLAPKHRLRAWLQVLALTAAQPARSWRASTIGRLDARVAGVSIAALSTPPAPRAREWLAELVSIRDRALREPLPVPVAPACEYAARRLGAAAEQQAFDEAGRRWQRDRLADDVHHVRCWGPGRRLRQIAGVADADDLLAWPDEPTRFGTLSRRIWEPLLRHEHLQQRRATTG